MYCRIADLNIEVPAAGGMSPRCVEYSRDRFSEADVVIDSNAYRWNRWPDFSESQICYMESGFQFHRALLHHEGLMLHSSAVELNGRAYLFSGPSRMGKSTHARLWKKVFGDAVQVFNDDKPALRRLDGVWFAYGTPWCGKDGINQNKKVSLGAICFLKRGESNTIRLLAPNEALKRVISQTPHRFDMAKNLDLMLSHVDHLVREIPIYELECLPNEDAAWLSYETMLRGAKEAGL